MSDYLIYVVLGVAAISGMLSVAAIGAAVAQMLYQRKRRIVRSQEELTALSVMLDQNQRYFKSQMDSMTNLSMMLYEIKKIEMAIVSLDEKNEDIYGKIADLTAILLKKLQ